MQGSSNVKGSIPCLESGTPRQPRPETERLHLPVQRSIDEGNPATPIPPLSRRGLLLLPYLFARHGFPRFTISSLDLHLKLNSASSCLPVSLLAPPCPRFATTKHLLLPDALFPLSLRLPWITLDQPRHRSNCHSFTSLDFDHLSPLEPTRGISAS